MIEISVIIPTFKRVAQTLKTIDFLFASNGWREIFDLEVIVADSSPDNLLQKTLEAKFGSKVIYTRPRKEGISSNKNKGARIATYPFLIFCDSDIEVEKNTILNTINSLRKHKTAAALGGQVFWRGGKRNGTLDRPRPEDRRKEVNGTVYIEALYSRYLATYKKVFWKVGGYDEIVFNMRGEGSDLSTRYWRQGYPLVFDSSIRTFHIHNVPDSAALRVKHPEWGIAKDLFLLAYKFNMFDGEYDNFTKTIAANFNKLGERAGFEIFQGVEKYFDFIREARQHIDKQKKTEPRFDFKFLEVFSEKKLLEMCIHEAEDLLVKTRERVFGLTI